MSQLVNDDRVDDVQHIRGQQVALTLLLFSILVRESFFWRLRIETFMGRSDSGEPFLDKSCDSRLTFFWICVDPA